MQGFGHVHGPLHVQNAVMVSNVGDGHHPQGAVGVSSAAVLNNAEAQAERDAYAAFLASVKRMLAKYPNLDRMGIERVLGDDDIMKKGMLLCVIYYLDNKFGTTY